MRVVEEFSTRRKMHFRVVDSQGGIGIGKLGPHSCIVPVWYRTREAAERAIARFKLEELEGRAMDWEERNPYRERT